jgi:uncharacterized protein (DUF608 family)
MRIGGAAAAGLVLAPWGYAELANDKLTIEKLIPTDKNLPDEWVHSLYAKGRPETVSSETALMHIGMPVGGLFCGTVYLGGDGKLWLWDVFNDDRNGILPKAVPYKGITIHYQGGIRSPEGACYIAPENTQPSVFKKDFPFNTSHKATISPDALQFRQGFALRIGDTVRTLDRKGWKTVTFIGSYPVGMVDYSDPDSPVSVRLEAFSPFIPLNTEESSLPVTFMRYTLKNTSGSAIQATIGGWLDNAVCCNSADQYPAAVRCNTPVAAPVVLVQGSASFVSEPDVKPARPDIVFDDFSSGTYAKWKVSGKAFGEGPVAKTAIPRYMQGMALPGDFAALSHNPAGGNAQAGDAFIGKLTSEPFTIERNYINFLVAGGSHPGKTCVNLLVDGKVVQTATGNDSHKFRAAFFDVRALSGKSACLEIVDEATGPWGNVSVARIDFSDEKPTPAKDARPFEKQFDYGTFCLALADGADAETLPQIPDGADIAKTLFSASADSSVSTTVPFSRRSPVFGIRKAVTVPANGTVTITFAVAWHFSNLNLGGELGRKPTIGADSGRHYARRFKDAAAVATYAVRNLDTLAAQTFRWRDTWYDSTLPRWFLDRAFVNTSILATTTCHRFGNGRFYAWEGIGSCEGTCTHVWQYAQALARLFPDIERNARENTDLGIGFVEKSGRIGFRAEHDMNEAVDGQAGRIMGMWREHCMSPDGEFLKRIWPNAKKAVQYLLDHDKDGDGILDGSQHNTLDAAWYGKIAWLSIQALGAWRAGELMAGQIGDAGFEKICRERRLTGQKNIEKELFNGNWFFHEKAPGHENAFGTYNGSFIDQLWGQSLAYQCGLGEIISSEKAGKALRSIWRYNFAKDLSAFLEGTKPGRPYVMPGEGGTVMCSNALNEDNPYGGKHWSIIYLSECMTGFEHQLASHMMRVGMVEEALAVTRVIHDRYNATKRNPYNEIECSDHYARAMASYGTFLAACGYDYNGPEGKLSFAPQKALGSDNFKAPFTVAEGWGTFAQQKSGNTLSASVSLKYGKLKLSEFSLATNGTKATASLSGSNIPATVKKNGSTATLHFSKPVVIEAGQVLEAKIN